MSTRDINSPLTGQLITLVCGAWGVSRADIAGSSRRQPLPWARAQLCILLCKYAGHDHVSCAAVIHHSVDAVDKYFMRYHRITMTYTPVAQQDKALHKKAKQLQKKYPL